jgi:hypothetical protein
MLFKQFFKHKLKSNQMWSEVCFDMVFKLSLKQDVFTDLTLFKEQCK